MEIKREMEGGKVRMEVGEMKRWVAREGERGMDRERVGVSERERDTEREREGLRVRERKRDS